MKILFIGGTHFLGRHLVAAAQARQHAVTVFHRGRHALAAGGVVEEICGDRTTELAKLRHRCWDAVVDTCGYLPQAVGDAAAALRQAAGHYTFISSLAAYADFSRPDYAETASLATLTAAQAAHVASLGPAAEPSAATLGEAYGALKAQCEQAVQQAFGDGSLVVRPGVLAGPYDPTDRCTYWASRVARGGEMLAPGLPSRFVQLIDARDVAAWLIGMVERRAAGVFNLANPAFSLSFSHFLATIKAATRSNATFTWVEEGFLQRHGVAAWSELPLYLPETDPSLRGFLAANCDRAVAAGLTLRPLAATIQDALAWRATEPGPLRAGLAPGREQALLRQWHAELPGAA